MEEIWKDIANYESLYKVSNLGHVKSCERVVYQKNHNNLCRCVYKGKLLAPHKRINGYFCVHLSKNGKTRWLSIHRLVAEAFVEKKDGCDIVNHLDNNTANNKADNLEWTTYKGNMQWASKQGRMKYNPENLAKAQETRKRKVVAIDKNGNEIEFNSIKEASLKLNCNRRHISQICKNRYGYKSSNGYTFKYKEE